MSAYLAINAIELKGHGITDALYGLTIPAISLESTYILWKQTYQFTHFDLSYSSIAPSKYALSIGKKCDKPTRGQLWPPRM